MSGIRESMAEFCKDLNEGFTERRTPNMAMGPPPLALISLIPGLRELLDICGILLHFPRRHHVPGIPCVLARGLIMLWLKTMLH